MSSTKYSPILKWAGGKNDLLSHIFPLFPKVIHHYYEPFLGGGSILIHLLQQIENENIQLLGEIHVNDKNQHLIHLYQTIQEDADALITLLQEFETIYHETQMNIYPSKFDFSTLIAQTHSLQECVPHGKQLIYYFLKHRFNHIELSKTEKSAIFLFLNKTCFRGLYRENKKGEMNVPFGNYEKPNICPTELIQNLHTLFLKYPITFHNLDYQTFLQRDFTTQDFIYVDPPYYPIDKNTFVAYQCDGFHQQEHETLMNLLIELKRKRIRWVLSNHKCDFIDEKFPDDYKIVISAKRRIHSKNPESKVDEYLVHSF